MTEDQMIEGCRKGDRKAQRALYDLTSERVYRLLSRMTGNEHDAFDLAQDTYLRALEHINQFDGSASLSTWVYRIAVNEALQFIRRRRTRDESLRRNETILRSELKTEDPDARLDVQEAVARLPEMERTLIVLKYFEGMDYAEMAQVLEKPAGTIASGLNRARQSLREILEGRLGPLEETRAERHPMV